VGVQAGHNHKQTGQSNATNATTDQRGMPGSPLIVETHPRPEDPKDVAKHEAENDTKENRDRWTFYFTIVNAIMAIVVTVFTGLLVRVGWRGVNAAVLTLKAIKGQGDDIRSQVAIMRTQFKQSVKFDNWKIEPPDNTGLVRVTVEIHNPSAFPMSIISGHIVMKNGSKLTRYNIGGSTSLHTNDMSIAEIRVALEDGQLAVLDASGRVFIEIMVEISHLHIVDETEVRESFEGGLICWEWGTRFNQYVRQQRTEEHGGEQKAN
jgi:hypothetical protein